MNKVQMLYCVFLMVFFDVTGLGAWDHIVNMRCKPYNKMQVSKICMLHVLPTPKIVVVSSWFSDNIRW